MARLLRHQNKGCELSVVPHSTLWTVLSAPMVQWQCTARAHILSQHTSSARAVVWPTPANEHVDGEADVVGVDDEQQCVQVETLHQQPEEVGHNEVVEEHQTGLAAHLQQHALLQNSCKSTSFSSCLT